MMRAVYEKEGGETKDFIDVKKRAEAYFSQPDIPLHPVVHLERIPMSRGELEEELARTDMGLAWRMVAKARPVPRDRSLKRPRPQEDEESD
jgi:hypothetical protein